MSDSTDSIEKEGTPKYSVPDDVEQEHEWRFRFQHDDDHQLWWLSTSDLQAVIPLAIMNHDPCWSAWITNHTGIGKPRSYQLVLGCGCKNNRRCGSKKSWIWTNNSCDGLLGQVWLLHHCHHSGTIIAVSQVSITDNCSHISYLWYWQEYWYCSTT